MGFPCVIVNLCALLIALSGISLCHCKLGWTIECTATCIDVWLLVYCKVVILSSYNLIFLIKIISVDYIYCSASLCREKLKSYHWKVLFKDDYGVPTTGLLPFGRCEGGGS